MLQKPLLYPVLQGMATSPTEEQIQTVVDEATRVMMSSYTAQVRTVSSGSHSA